MPRIHSTLRVMRWLADAFVPLNGSLLSKSVSFRLTFDNNM